MKYEATDFRFDLATAGLNEVTPEQAWMLVKLAKHSRQRMKNNAALNNWFGAAFPHLRFTQVTKYKASGEAYEGLSITWRDSARQATAIGGSDDEE